MERFFVDTSAWFAYVNKGDCEHGPVRQVLRNVKGRLVTSNFIFDETITFCLHRLGYQAAVKVGKTLLNTAEIDLIRVTPADERQAWSLFLQRPDNTYSYTDCTSFVVMRRLSMQYAISLDSDFRREGFHLLPANKT